MKKAEVSLLDTSRRGYPRPPRVPISRWEDKLTSDATHLSLPFFFPVGSSDSQLSTKKEYLDPFPPDIAGDPLNSNNPENLLGALVIIRQGTCGTG